MRTHRLALGLVLALALSACATTPTPYAPAARTGGYGYSETQIETDRYRISFRSNTGANARADDLALLRAAELTLQRGYDWFAVTQRGTEQDAPERSGPRVSVGVGGGNYGGHTSIGVGAGIDLPIGAKGERGDARTTIEIRMGKGPKPADAQTFDARDVERSIRPRA